MTRPRSTNAALQRLLREVRACTICTSHLPLPPRPVLQAGAVARILIAGQAPGRKLAASGVPFDDASGDRLRTWMGIDKAAFYDPDFIAILPMGFCYPGTGASGDLAPRPECAATWRARLLEQLPALRLTLVIGTYAQAWHLKPASTGANLTATVGAWREQGVTDRRNGATDVRRIGASNRWVKRTSRGGYAGVDFEGFCGVGLPAAAICLGARYDCPSSTRQ